MIAAPWLLTASGLEYQLGGPLPVVLGNAPVVKDIAHHLAQINRFNGAASRPYSVAEHSLLVERIGAQRGASPGLRLALLMHDAHEAYTGDQTSPSKDAIGMDWIQFESMHALNIRQHFGLRTAFAAWRDEIRRCDLIALATERRDLMPWDPAEHRPWPVLDTPGAEVAPLADERIPAEDSLLTWAGWRDAFVARYLQLRELVDAQARGVATA